MVMIVIENWLSIVKDMLLSLSDFKLNRRYLINGASERRHCFLVVDLLGFRFRVRCYFADFHMTIRRDRGPWALSWVTTCWFLHWKLIIVDDYAVFSWIYGLLLVYILSVWLSLSFKVFLILVIIYLGSTLFIKMIRMLIFAVLEMYCVINYLRLLLKADRGLAFVMACKGFTVKSLSFFFWTIVAEFALLIEIWKTVRPKSSVSVFNALNFCVHVLICKAILALVCFILVSLANFCISTGLGCS